MKSIAFLVYENMELLDLSGIQTAIYTANQFSRGSYELKTIGFEKGPLTCESGTKILADLHIDDLPDCHTLIIPGGIGARTGTLTHTENNSLVRLIGESERIVTICTGVFMLAKTGLVDGLNVATHWAFTEQLQCECPNLIVDKDKLFMREKMKSSEQQVWTSAGVTSGIDLALRLIELDIDKTTAINVAQYLVVYLKRSGSQQQFSGVLDLQTPRSDIIATVINWMKENLSKTISVQQMADQANLSERQFRRLFMRDTGCTPANYLEELRMDTAKNLLLNSDKSIKQLALNLGFNTADGFRRAFERKYSISPSQYRIVFGGSQ